MALSKDLKMREEVMWVTGGGMFLAVETAYAKVLR